MWMNAWQRMNYSFRFVSYKCCYCVANIQNIIDIYIDCWVVYRSLEIYKLTTMHRIILISTSQLHPLFRTAGLHPLDHCSQIWPWKKRAEKVYSLLNNTTSILQLIHCSYIYLNIFWSEWVSPKSVHTHQRGLKIKKHTVTHTRFLIYVKTNSNTIGVKNC
jgi:hypothetical protein